MKAAVQLLLRGGHSSGWVCAPNLVAGLNASPGAGANISNGGQGARLGFLHLNFWRSWTGSLGGEVREMSERSTFVGILRVIVIIAGGSLGGGKL